MAERCHPATPLLTPPLALAPLQTSDNVLDWTVTNLYREGDEVRRAGTPGRRRRAPLRCD